MTYHPEREDWHQKPPTYADEQRQYEDDQIGIAIVVVLGVLALIGWLLFH